MASRTTPINQEVVLDIKAKTNNIEASVKNLITKLQSAGLADNFTRSYITSLQKVLNKSQELKKVISDTNEVNSKTVTQWSSAYNKLTSELTRTISKLENSSIDFKDLIGYDKATFNKLLKNLDDAKKAQNEIYNNKNVTKQSNLTLDPLIKGSQKLQDTVLKNINDEQKVADVIDEQIAKLNQEVTLAKAKAKATEDELKTFQQLLAAMKDRDKVDLRTTVGQNIKNLVGGADAKEVTANFNAQRNKIEANLTKAANAAEVDATQTLTKVNTQIAQLVSYKTAAIAFARDLGFQFNEAAAPIDKATTELEQFIQAEIRAAMTDVSGVERDMQEVAGATQQASSVLENYGDELVEIEQRQNFFSNLQSRVTQIFGLANAFQLLRRFVTASWEAIKELDAAFTKIAVVTDKTTSDLWQSFSDYNELAQRLGVTTSAAIETSALFYQQGLETADVMILTTETLKMAQIAGMGYTEATQAMTAAIRGFKLEMQDASRVTDVYSALAAKAAVDTQQLATAISKTASIAGSAGLSFESASAFLTQIIETTQEAAETAGTALKTIIARFTELTKDPTQLTIEVEGEVVDANKIEAALRLADVNLRDTNGQFRDLDTVFLELAKSWDTLDRNTQRYIATTAAGSRQQSRFLALMSDYERTQELVKIANDSAGASEIQFAKTLDSVSAKVNKLKSNFEALIGNLINNNTVKGFLNLLNNGLSILVKISEKGLASFAIFIVTVGLLIKRLLTSVIGVFSKIGKAWEIKRAEISKDILIKLRLDTKEAEAEIARLRNEAQGTTRTATGATVSTGGTPTTPNSPDFIGPLSTKQVNKNVFSVLTKSVGAAALSGMATGLLAGVTSGDWSTGLTIGITSTLMNVFSNPAIIRGFGSLIIGGAGGKSIATLAKTAITAVGGAISSAILPLAIGAAVAALAYGAYKLFDPLEKAKREAKKLREELEKAEEATQKSKVNFLTEKENLKTLSDQISRYTELRDKIDITNDEQAELNELANQLGNDFPQLISYYDEAGDLVLKQGQYWEDILDTQKQIALLAQQEYGTDLINSAQLSDQTRIGDMKEIQERIKKEDDDLTSTFLSQIYNGYQDSYAEILDLVTQAGFSAKQIPSIAEQFGMSAEQVKYLKDSVDSIEVLEAKYTSLGKQATLTQIAIENAYKANAQNMIELYNLTSEQELDTNLYSALQTALGEQLQLQVDPEIDFDKDKNLTEEAIKRGQDTATEFLTAVQNQLDVTEIDTETLADKMATSTKTQFLQYLKKDFNITEDTNSQLYTTLLVQFEIATEGRQGILSEIFSSSLGSFVGVDPATVAKAQENIEQMYLDIFGSDAIERTAELYGNNTGAKYLQALVRQVQSGQITDSIAQALAGVDLSTVEGAQIGFNKLIESDVDQAQAKTIILKLSSQMGFDEIVNKDTLLSLKAARDELNQLTKAANKGISASVKLSKGYLLTNDEISELLELYPDLQDELANYTNEAEGSAETLADALSKASAQEAALSFYETLDENLSTLADSQEGTIQYEQALDRVRTLLGDPSWDPKVNGLSLIQDAIDGDTEAVETLRKALQDQFVISVIGQSNFEALKADLLTVDTIGQAAFNQLSKIAGFKTVRKMIFPGTLGAPPIWADVLEYQPENNKIPTYTRKSTGGGGGGKKDDYSTKTDKYYNEIQAISTLQDKLEKLSEARERGDLTPEQYRANIDETGKYYKALQNKLYEYNNLLRADQAKLINDINTAGYGEALKVLNGQLMVNKSLIEGLSPTTQKTIDDQISAYEDLSETIAENSDEWMKAQQKQLDLLEQSKEAYIDLEQKIIDILIEQDRLEIEAQEKKYDALKKADNDYLEALKDNIDKRRKARDKEESYSDLAKKEKRLALLKRDTSGIYASEILALEEEITQQRQDLADQETDDMVAGLEEQATTREEAYDKELEELNSLQEDKEKSMTEYNKRANDIMAQGYDQLKFWLMQNDTEYTTATAAAQQAYIESWTETISQASALAGLLNITGQRSAMQEQAFQKAEKARNVLSNTQTQNEIASGGTTYASGAKQISALNAEGALAFYNQHVKERTDVSNTVKDLFWQIVLAKFQYDGKGLPSGATRGFSQGGLVDYTGPAMVHGSASRPEAFLSADDTRNFQTLAQLLSSAIAYNGTSGETPESGSTTVMGDINITIEVAELGDDYDVEQMVEKVKQEIVNSSSYRNINLISKVR